MSEPILEQTMEDEGTEWAQHYTVENDQDAEWCIQQIKNAEEEKKKWKEFYDDRYQKVCATCDLTIANMECVLQTYFDKVPHKTTKTQENYQLPSGKLVIKKQAPEYERDDEQILDWLHRSGKEQFVKTKETVDWSGLKSTLNIVGETASDEFGEIVPGLKVIEREDIFKVELKKEG